MHYSPQWSTRLPTAEPPPDLSVTAAPTRASRTSWLLDEIALHLGAVVDRLVAGEIVSTDPIGRSSRGRSTTACFSVELCRSSATRQSVAHGTPRPNWQCETNDSFPPERRPEETAATGERNDPCGANWAVGGDKAERRLSDSKSGRCPWGLLRQALSERLVALGSALG